MPDFPLAPALRSALLSMAPLLFRRDDTDRAEATTRSTEAGTAEAGQFRTELRTRVP